MAHPRHICATSSGVRPWAAFTRSESWRSSESISAAASRTGVTVSAYSCFSRAMSADDHFRDFGKAPRTAETRPSASRRWGFASAARLFEAELVAEPVVDGASTSSDHARTPGQRLFNGVARLSSPGLRPFLARQETPLPPSGAALRMSGSNTVTDDDQLGSLLELVSSELRRVEFDGLSSMDSGVVACQAGCGPKGPGGPSCVVAVLDSGRSSGLRFWRC